MATRSLDDRVTALENTVAGLQNLPGELAAFRQEVNARFDAVDARISSESEDLYARMRLLHEALVTQITTIGEGLTGGDRPERRRRPKR